MRPCFQCGELFEPVNGQATLCSEPCYRLRSRDLKRLDRALALHGDEQATCKGCSTTFDRRRSFRITYCSKACVESYASAHPPQTRVYSYACKQCGRRGYWRRPRVLCSAECRTTFFRRYNAEKYRLTIVKLPERECAQCKTPFRPSWPRQRFCRRRCQYRWAHQNRPDRILKANHLTRALRYGVQYEDIDWRLVCERDGWRCYLCGRATPKVRRGSFAPDAPELDHVVPFSRGGSHTYGNVRCACRGCNIAKSDTPPAPEEVASNGEERA